MSIALLAEIAEPTHGVITNIGRAHLQGFGGVKGVLKGKRELFDFFRNKPGTLTSDISVFVNQNHSVLVEASDSIPRAFYGSQQHPPFVSEVHDDFNMSWVDLEGSLHGPMRCQVSGDHNFENMMTAAAVGLYFGVSADACSDALSSYAPDNNRSQWTKTERNQVLLDAYNANPSSMEVALDNFKSIQNSHKLAVLGDMFELGTTSAKEHLAVVNRAIVTKDCVFYFVGSHFFEHKTDHPKLQFFKTFDDLQLHLEQSKISNTSILIKGSRGMALERVLPLLE